MLERKKRTRNLIILLVLLLVALAVIAYFLLRSLGVFGGNVTVPDVVGLSASQATQTLQNDHLTVGSSTVRASNTTKGDVVSTDPKSGASRVQELRGEPRRERRSEHPHRRRPDRHREAADPGHRAAPGRRTSATRSTT